MPLSSALSALAALVAFVPFGDLRVLGAPLAWLAGTLLGIRRAHVEAALSRAQLANPRATASAMYTSLATGVMELLWLAGAPRRELASVVSVDPDSAVVMDEVLASHRGAVFAASHTGNWELAACAMAARVPLSVLVKRVSIGGFDRFMRAMRTKYRVGLLEGEGALAEARREVEAGRVVAVLMDQVREREEHGEWLPFLGADASTDRAPAMLAASTGVPFVVTASRRTADGGHVLHVLSVKRPPMRGRSGWVRQATREATDELAGFVMRHPDQWLWMHRRWKRGA